MRDLVSRMRVAAERRAATLADALIETAVAELPDLDVERIEAGVALTGSDLARRLAYDGRLRGLTLTVRGRR